MDGMRLVARPFAPIFAPIFPAICPRSLRQSLQAAAACALALPALALSVAQAPPDVQWNKPFVPPTTWRPATVTSNFPQGQPVQLREAIVNVEVFGDQTQTRIELRLFPEEYSLKSAKPGTYRIDAQFYGERQQVLSAGTTVMVRVTTGFGTPQARDEWTSVRLTNGREVARIAEVQVR